MIVMQKIKHMFHLKKKNTPFNTTKQTTIIMNNNTHLPKVATQEIQRLQKTQGDARGTTATQEIQSSILQKTQGDARGITRVPETREYTFFIRQWQNLTAIQI